MHEVWWGTFPLRRGQHIEKQIGPLSLAFKVELNECQIYYNYLADWMEDSEEESRSLEQLICSDNLKERYILRNTDEKLSLLPILADRSVITKPVTPIYIPSKQKVTIFVSTPLWVRAEYGPEKILLKDIAVIRPSDTWFGPNTMEGEICYASQTKARFEASNLPKRYHRATTPVHIFNDSASHLLLERINLPVTHLEVYLDANNRFWTQAVKMINDQDNETAEMLILPGSPAEASKSTLIGEPREMVVEKTIIRKISGFFG